MVKIGNIVVERDIFPSRNALCNDFDQIIHLVGKWEGFWLDWDSLDDVSYTTGYLLQACS